MLLVAVSVINLPVAFKDIAEELVEELVTPFPTPNVDIAELPIEALLLNGLSTVLNGVETEAPELLNTRSKAAVLVKLKPVLIELVTALPVSNADIAELPIDALLLKGLPTVLNGVETEVPGLANTLSKVAVLVSVEPVVIGSVKFLPIVEYC